MGDYVARHILAELPPNKKDKLNRPFTPEDRRRWLEMCCGREAKFHLLSKLSLTVQGHTHTVKQMIQATEKYGHSPHVIL